MRTQDELAVEFQRDCLIDQNFEIKKSSFLRCEELDCNHATPRVQNVLKWKKKGAKYDLLYFVKHVH